MNETSIIARHFQSHTQRADVLLGIGDDAAILKAEENLVMSLDSLVVERHFRMDDTPADIGYKALASNLSDIAAMGATPCWAMLSLSLPPEIDEAWIAEFMQGFNALAKAWDVLLIGGDLVRGPLVISIQITGKTNKPPLLRSGAQPGDRILMTGDIGAAGLAWHRDALLSGLDASLRDACRERLLHPQPRIAEGLLIADFAHAAIDISDGIFLDLKRVLDASKVGAELKLDQVALNPAIAEIPLKDDWLLPFMAGDDYELLFTLDSSQFVPLTEAFAKAGIKTPLTQVGTITAPTDLQCFYHGKNVALPEVFGFDHFGQQIK